ncbi:hypothetical protein JGS22_009720, partial [Streptomyces sp. P38-E01]|nr:hypothetical protein [Streptomyces tardus]
RPAPQPSTVRQLGSRFDAAVVRYFLTVVSHALGPYQTAILRIGVAATWLFFLLREVPHRHELYGPESPWAFSLAEQLIERNKAFTVLLWSDGTVWFELVYFGAVAASLALMLGWRTRTMSVLFMVGVFSLQNRSVFMGDGGDNVIHLMAFYLIFTRCAQVWSLDARRARRTEAALRAGADPDSQLDRTGVVLLVLTGFALGVPTLLGLFTLVWGLFFWALWLIQLGWFLLQFHGTGEPRSLATAVANLAHNAALVVIMAEVCLIYATAGWYKVQGSRWQDGTATWYPLHLDYFAPFPALADILASSGLIVMVITYGTVMVQVAFPFTLFNRRIKNVLLALMIVEHVSIAVLLGLPFFSMAMIAADAVFLPTVFLLWLGARVTGVRERVLGRLGRGPHGKKSAPRAPWPILPSPAGPPVGEATSGEAAYGEGPAEPAHALKAASYRPAADRPDPTTPGAAAGTPPTRDTGPEGPPRDTPPEGPRPEPPGPQEPDGGR